MEIKTMKVKEQGEWIDVDTIKDILDKEKVNMHTRKLSNSEEQTSTSQVLSDAKQATLCINNPGKLSVGPVVETAQEAKVLNDFCHCLNLTQLIDKPTRVTSCSSTLIDVMMTSNKDLIAESGVLEIYISDNFLVYCSLKLKLIKPHPICITARSYKHYNRNQFLCDLACIPWHENLFVENVNDKLSHFDSNFQNALARNAPIKTMKIRHRQVPFVDNEIKELMKNRNRIHKFARLTRMPPDWEKIKFNVEIKFNGSILGPVFLNIYINDLPGVPKESNLKSYVDDSKIYLAFSIRDAELAAMKLTEDMRRITTWCCLNSLLVNPEKTKLLILGTRQMLEQPQLSFTSSKEMISVDTEKIKRESQIYMLNPDDKLLDYHRAINENAFAVAREKPHLLASKIELQKLERQRLHESGFAYKRRESRSKYFGKMSTVEKPKREKLGEEMRQQQLSHVQEELKEVYLQLSYASRQRERCANVNNFTKAIEMSKEMEELRQKKSKYQEEKIGSTNSSDVSAGKDITDNSFDQLHSNQQPSDNEESIDLREVAKQTSQESLPAPEQDNTLTATSNQETSAKDTHFDQSQNEKDF
ncbi:Hypothetical predicted protein [Paramuricea clavata]|uniref:Uncharacterized protein n=1 Tax=Paramuricea clavata TaxID=317549 RepID=A0A6S7IQT2_PARCT|nr:Hypothetical predicted protein [Paramuricea clavata]